MQSTSSTLLAKLSDPSDRAAWDRFAFLYRPWLLSIGKRSGLQESAAEDLAQTEDGQTRQCATDYTGEGTLLGTPAYMAPEQASALAVVDRIWSFRDDGTG